MEDVYERMARMQADAQEAATGGGLTAEQKMLERLNALRMPPRRGDNTVGTQGYDGGGRYDPSKPSLTVNGETGQTKTFRKARSAKSRAKDNGKMQKMPAMKNVEPGSAQDAFNQMHPQSEGRSGGRYNPNMPTQNMEGDAMRANKGGKVGKGWGKSKKAKNVSAKMSDEAALKAISSQMGGEVPDGQGVSATKKRGRPKGSGKKPSSSGKGRKKTARFGPESWL